MNILILGSGGREHAFAWKITESPKCDKLYIAPGNAGTGLVGENVAIDPTSFPEVGDFAISHNIDLIVVGPEVPLSLGIKDYFEQREDLKNIPMVGPGKRAALLESSKDFAKEFMNKYRIPTASHATFDQARIEEGIEYLRNHTTPIVLKADGLAAGKGVVICDSRPEAERFIITDGKSYKILPSAKDYKRIGENDTGPNTGGMGAVSPVPFADDAFMMKVEQQIIKPTIEGIQAEGLDYRGFIFLGLINVDGEPKVIEYNARMGDPETQVVFPRISSDLVDLLVACTNGTLDQVKLKLDPRTACTVVMVAEGYPGKYQKGMVIDGLQKPLTNLVFHAGTKMLESSIVTNGGRVLAITAYGENLEQALSSAYGTIKEISWLYAGGSKLGIKSCANDLTSSGNFKLHIGNELILEVE